MKKKSTKKRNQPKQSSDPDSEQSHHISKKKSLFFSLTMLLIPLFFLLILESVLIFFHYDGHLGLVKSNISDDRFYQLNYEIGKKYFPKFEVTTAISYDVFYKKKPANGYRIFVLGGSSAAGYPYMNNGAFSRMLCTQLQAQFPDRMIEVINTAMPAVNTFTILDFVNELIHYQPDAFLVYAGHNEFYGALGVGSTETLGKSRSVIKLYLLLQKYRTFRLVRNIIGSIKNLVISKIQSSASDDATLMERMVGKSEIPYHGDDYQRALTFFKANITEIIRTAKKHHIDIILSELVSNIRDQQPLISIFEDDKNKQEWSRIVEQGLMHQQNSDYTSALESYLTACKLDAAPAILYYLMAQCYERLGEMDSARVNYYRAKDFDALRFRASEDFNVALHEICDNYDIPLVSIIHEFETASPHGLIGDHLMTDHLHPNLEGFFLIATAFYRVMEMNSMISVSWNSQNALPDSIWKTRLGVTELDMRSAQLKIDILKGGWPFQSKGTVNTALLFKPKTYLEQVIHKWQNHELNWEQAHVQMAEYYSKTGELDNAAAEYLALIIGTPYNEAPYLKLAEIRILQQQYAQASEVLKQSLKAAETTYAYKWIGTITLNNGQAQEALPYLGKAVQMDSADQQTMYNLSGAYHMSGNSKKALELCENLRRLNPNYPGLREFMDGLKRLEKREHSSYEDTKVEK